MKVKDLMTRHPATCHPTTCLHDVAQLMWDRDCGVVPVVDDTGKGVGVITDRDICMAAKIKNKRLGEIPVKDVVSGRCYQCNPEDDIHVALRVMKEQQVHRLPVLRPDGKVEGMLSIHDIALAAREKPLTRQAGVAYAELVETLTAICQPRHMPELVSAPV